MALSVLQAKRNWSRRDFAGTRWLILNFWYWLSTQTIFGNKIFAATIHNPGWFLSMLKLFNRLGVLNQSVYKFVNHFLHDKQKRKQLYLRWTCLRKIRPDLAIIKQIISKITFLYTYYMDNTTGSYCHQEVRIQERDRSQLYIRHPELRAPGIAGKKHARHIKVLTTVILYLQPPCQSSC
jgi:hypothetical protein